MLLSILSMSPKVSLLILFEVVKATAIAAINAADLVVLVVVRLLSLLLWSSSPWSF